MINVCYLDALQSATAVKSLGRPDGEGHDGVGVLRETSPTGSVKLALKAARAREGQRRGTSELASCVLERGVDQWMGMHSQARVGVQAAGAGFSWPTVSKQNAELSGLQ